VLIATNDSRGTIYDPGGLDLGALIPLKEAGRPVCDYPGGQKLARDAIIDIECDVWIPAARPDVIREDNVERLRAKLVVQGANIPFTEGAERMLHARGVLVVPDFIANAGGVICAAMEYHGATQAQAFDAIQEKLQTNTRHVLEEAKQRKLLPREAAVNLAVQRVREAMGYRRWGIL
jgi:glutamate dehydrogenase (NAD(P)+)